MGIVFCRFILKTDNTVFGLVCGVMSHKNDWPLLTNTFFSIWKVCAWVMLWLSDPRPRLISKGTPHGVTNWLKIGHGQRGNRMTHSQDSRTLNKTLELPCNFWLSPFGAPNTEMSIIYLQIATIGVWRPVCQIFWTHTSHWGKIFLESLGTYLGTQFWVPTLWWQFTKSWLLEPNSYSKHDWVIFGSKS